MTEPLLGRPPSVSSIYANLEQMIGLRAPRAAQALLGARWSFHLPSPAERRQLTEYSWPGGTPSFPDLALLRTGLRIVEHSGPAADELHRHLGRGHPAIVMVDSFLLPYRPAFGRVHSHRTVLVEPGRARGEVWIRDGWPPAYTGSLAAGALEAARYSDVPLEPALEPVFAGRPVHGEWIDIDLLPRPLTDQCAWASELVGLLLREGTGRGTAGTGIAALRRLRAEVPAAMAGPADERAAWSRGTSLLLRAELSSRVYLCALLGSLAARLGDSRLRAEVHTYHARLRAMETARDLLVKCLRSEHGCYPTWVSRALERASAAEEGLAAALAACQSGSPAHLPRVRPAQGPGPRPRIRTGGGRLMIQRSPVIGINVDDYDPYGLVSPAIFTDPHPIYHMLRYAEPVHWSQVLNAWVLTSYGDVFAALRDPRLSSALRREIGTAALAPALQERMRPIDRFLSLWVLNLDDPEHRRLRSLLSQGFTPRAMEAMRPHVESIASELLAALPADGRIDFVAQYARPLPVRVIAEMFGVPETDRPRLAEWSRHISRFFEFGPSRPDVLENMTTSMREMTDYLRLVVADHRAHPREDVLNLLILAQDRGENLTEDQLLATCVMLLFAGHDSTVNLLGNGMLALLQHPDQLALLRADPGLAPNAMQEFLRFEPPVIRHDRVSREDFELHGHPVRAGQRVVLGLGAANRDPARFPNPDTLDITRKDASKHTTFGGGPHACIGGALAISQAVTAITLLLDRYPEISLAPEPYRWRQHFNFRGLRNLPLELAGGRLR
jgi:cytochrome P450